MCFFWKTRNCARTLHFNIHVHLAQALPKSHKMCEHANIGGQNRTSFVDVRTSFVGDVRTGGGDVCLRSYNLVQSRIYTSKKYTPSKIQSSAKLTKVFVPARKIVETSSSRAQEQFPQGMEKLDSGCNIECTCCNYLHIFFLLKI